MGPKICLIVSIINKKESCVLFTSTQLIGGKKMNREMNLEYLKRGFYASGISHGAAKVGCINILRVAYQVGEELVEATAYKRSKQYVEEKLKQGLPIDDLFTMCLYLCIEKVREREEVPFELVEVLDSVEGIYDNLIKAGKRSVETARVIFSKEEIYDMLCGMTKTDEKGIITDGSELDLPELVREFEECLPKYVKKCQMSGVGNGDRAVLKRISRFWKKAGRLLERIINGRIELDMLKSSRRLLECVQQCIEKHCGVNCVGMGIEQVLKMYEKMVKEADSGALDEEFEKVCYEAVLASVV